MTHAALSKIDKLIEEAAHSGDREFDRNLAKAGDKWAQTRRKGLANNLRDMRKRRDETRKQATKALKKGEHKLARIENQDANFIDNASRIASKKPNFSEGDKVNSMLKKPKTGLFKEIRAGKQMVGKPRQISSAKG
jgi:hypothetical protein